MTPEEIHEKQQGLINYAVNAIRKQGRLSYVRDEEGKPACLYSSELDGTVLHCIAGHCMEHSPHQHIPEGACASNVIEEIGCLKEEFRGVPFVHGMLDRLQQIHDGAVTRSAVSGIDEMTAFEQKLTEMMPGMHLNMPDWVKPFTIPELPQN